MILKTGGASPLLLKKIVLQLSLKIINRVPSYRVGQASELTYKARSPAQHLSLGKVPAVVFYCKPFTTKELRRHRLSHWVNNMAVFTILMMSLRVNSIKAEKKSGNADHYSH